MAPESTSTQTQFGELGVEQVLLDLARVARVGGVPHRVGVEPPLEKLAERAAARLVGKGFEAQTLALAPTLHVIGESASFGLALGRRGSTDPSPSGAQPPRGGKRHDRVGRRSARGSKCTERALNAQYKCDDGLHNMDCPS
jgi:hypothetical protein